MVMAVNPYRLTLEEVRDSGKTCVVIDETGNPGQSTGSSYLHPDRKSWAAVVLSPQQFKEVASELPPTLEELKRLCGGAEFHMTDIYRGHKSFKAAEVEQRLGAIAFLAHIFRENKYPIFFQTLDPVGAKQFADPLFQRKLGVLDLRKHEELALWMLLSRVQEYISDNKNNLPHPAYFVLDESEKWKDSRSVDIQKTVINPTLFASKKIYSRNSVDFPAIQLADFAAYCINRQQWLLTLPKEKITQFDLAFLSIVSNAGFNTINIPQVKVDLKLWQPSDYDFLRGVDDDFKGLPGRTK